MTVHSDGPRSRRERPAKPALTRPGIIAAAVEIMRGEGLERVTMRRLAQQLDTGPASLYVYVRNTAELHAAVLDELLGAVDLTPVHAEGDWRERLETVLVSYTTVLFEHPGLARSALVARPSGEHYLTLIEGLLALLDEGGVPGAQAAWGVDVLLQHATATAAEHATRGRAAGAQQEWDALTRALHGAREQTHPHIAALAAELLSGAPQDRLSWGFHMLINGIAQTPRPTPSQEPPRH
ncbi:TetR/AcrR family transcriptional regulator [Streptantibioticus ferralitis]|uniref:TetR/AcrR family transcriptional regulator C-terminal domain-containing protein n=1 Tax=Streptantibioticus ferralitis TaxID=236510 RepID=A0ABT5Z6P5_9ACTN|nr:TetR/AcrR family transcriptional regulator C-terminal domain-containing protein [Streptantibioticus ferralitis]MDF2259216.1 TetR/AcrR family transcriptional regulator C-terminal domain-containing protein [Streptantibioticus ferralitis]